MADAVGTLGGATPVLVGERFIEDIRAGGVGLMALYSQVNVLVVDDHSLVAVAQDTASLTVLTASAVQ